MKPSTNRRKKTHRPTSDWETKVFPKQMGKSLYRQNSFKLCKGLEIPLISKPFQNKIPNSTTEFLTVSIIENRNRQIASKRSNRTRVICEPHFHSSKVKRPKTSCDQFEATKETCLQLKISYGKAWEIFVHF